MGIQLFRDTEFNIRFDKVIARVKNLQGAMAYRMFDEIAGSKMFGYFIWDNNLSDLAPYFSREYFASNFNAILAALQVAGTFEAYLTIIRSALGPNTLVTFDSPEPSHLIINIGNPTGLANWGAYTDDEIKQVIPTEGLAGGTLIGVDPALVDVLGLQNLGIVDDMTPTGTGAAGNYFVFQRSTSGLTVNETLKLIELLNVNGVFVEVNFL